MECGTDIVGFGPLRGRIHNTRVNFTACRLVERETVQKNSIVVVECLEHPKNTRSAKIALLVVNDKHVIVLDTQLAHAFIELGLVGHHMGIGGRFILDLLNVKESGSRNAFLFVLFKPISACIGEVPSCIDWDNVRRQLADFKQCISREEPVGLDRLLNGLGDHVVTGWFYA